MDCLRRTEDDRAVLVHIRAQPGAARTMLRGVYGQALKIAVAAPPVDGKANVALVAFLAGVCGLPKSAVRLVKGAGSRDKVFRLEGIDRAQAAGALHQAGLAPDRR
ncbi:DUF167 domain-containing protein [Desulfurivibrio dismutans]|uniref:DUF167 domain-containing protein n=1 Tax=Desulfurivibrio dismutans TaxID=1398908 RepID=UPI0023DB9ECE|nr:DUF167 domain-containing protein [Desulfurivibrio alkaliphilus]MDF1615628.1 DUF167 domain-containing protein [Desulfurivibrio alkaliphilus]